MVKRALMRHIYCVCIGEAKYLWLVLANGFTAAVLTNGLYLPIMIKRDVM